MKREDDYLIRRRHLKDLTDEELENRFWMLAEEIVNPLILLAKNHTTPSIERSILMRMGFSSMEAKIIVQGVIDHGLMGKGAGHIVYRLAKEKSINIREAGLALMEDEHWNDVLTMFKGGKI